MYEALSTMLLNILCKLPLANEPLIVRVLSFDRYLSVGAEIFPSVMHHRKIVVGHVKCCPCIASELDKIVLLRSIFQKWRTREGI